MPKDSHGDKAQVPALGQEEQEVVGKFCRQAEVMLSRAAQCLNFYQQTWLPFLLPVPCSMEVTIPDLPQGPEGQGRGSRWGGLQDPVPAS